MIEITESCGLVSPELHLIIFNYNTHVVLVVVFIVGKLHLIVSFGSRDLRVVRLCPACARCTFAPLSLCMSTLHKAHGSNNNIITTTTQQKAATVATTICIPATIGTNKLAAGSQKKWNEIVCHHKQMSIGQSMWRRQLPLLFSLPLLPFCSPLCLLSYLLPSLLPPFPLPALLHAN